MSREKPLLHHFVQKNGASDRIMLKYLVLMIFDIPISIQPILKVQGRIYLGSSSNLIQGFSLTSYTFLSSSDKQSASLASLHCELTCFL